jgi:two-component system, LytTR family, sensor kinase
VRRARVWLAVWLGWTALALFFATSTSLTYRSTGRPANWSLTIQRALSEWWLWALLTPLVVWLASRFPLHGRHRVRHGAVHLVCGAAIALFKTAADRIVFGMLTGFWPYWLASTLALQFALYLAVVAAAHGAEYYRRSREREHLEAQLADTRLQMLNMQLQPHFLFNTLNTIAEIVHEDPDKADAMIGGLSDLLRRTLDLKNTLAIPLGDEIDLVSRYLDIQRTRFGDRLQVRMAIAPEASAVRIPPLLLQPIVENAIHHGLAARLDAGRIDITADVDGPILRVVVWDDGSGDAGEVIAGPERIGLGNTRARLEALYGTRARLKLAPAEGRGTRVTIEVPR